MKLFNWQKADDLSLLGLEENRLTEITIAGKPVGLLKRNNVIHAFAAKCPHAGTPLCEGWLDARGNIVCPGHKYRFDPVNGRNTTGEGYKLFIYPVEVRGDEVFIGLPAEQ